jgi:CRP/FNR family cyclic AMP-dependent transcriptional regulator
MAIDYVSAALLRLPIFAGLKPLQITEIARRAVHCEFRSGEVITRVGVAADAAYLVLSGEADGRPGPGSRSGTEPIAPGSLLAELAMFVDHLYGVTAVARSPVQCLKLTRAAMHAQMREDPDVARRLARVIRERLTRIAHELQEIDELLRDCETPAAAQVAMRRPLRVPDMRGRAAK